MEDALSIFGLLALGASIVDSDKKCIENPY
jgi:hypothetical protein